MIGCSRELSVETKSRAGDLRGFPYLQGEEVSVLGRPGSDILFQALRLSTIGAGEFNGRVRDGIGYGLPANTTRPAKDGKSRIGNQAWAQITTLDFEASWTF